MPSTAAKPFSFVERLKEIDMFFAGTDRVHETMRRVVAKLEEAKIPFAIAGGMAVNAHRYERTTGDVDILVAIDGFRAFVRRFVGSEFQSVENRTKRFLDPTTGVTFDFLITGQYPGSGKPGPIAYPDPATVAETIEAHPVVNLPTLIQLKLAARRSRDFGDVVELIRFNHLDESFIDKLHPTLHQDYIECLEEKRREDEYEARREQEIREILRQEKKSDEKYP
jgi:hypothetical protein